MPIASSKFSALPLLFLALFSCCIPSVSFSAEKEKKAKKETWLITAFPEIKQGETMESFMLKVSNMLQNPLITGLQPVGYLDQNGTITSQSQKAYENAVRQEFFVDQIRTFSPYDTNSDGTVTLKEMADRDKIKIEHVEALYKTAKAHGTQAVDEVDKVFGDMIKAKAGVHPNSFYIGIMLPFAELDLDGDRKLNSTEVRTPRKSKYQRITQNVLDEFQALQSLPNDGKPVTVQTVSDFAVKTFKYFDKDKSGEISYDEYLLSFYTRRAEESKITRKLCKLPDLSDSSGPTYALILPYSRASTSLKFHSLTDYTNYVEVQIEKQATPVNLLLINPEGSMVWNIKGDTKSVNKVLVFGSSGGMEDFESFWDVHDRYLQESNIPAPNYKTQPSEEISAAVIGVPKDEIHFADVNFCLDLERTNDWEFISESEKAGRTKSNERSIGHAIGLKKPHILVTQTYGSHVLVKSSPEIAIDSKNIDVSTTLPKGYKQKYWDLFLQAVPKGHKFLDTKAVVSGSSYRLNSPYYPLWGGLAQLEHDGLLEELKFDPAERKVTFLLKNNLPLFMGATSTNPWNVTLIADKEDLTVPYMESAGPGSHYCVMTRTGKYIYGDEQRCSKSELGVLKKKSQPLKNATNAVYLRMDKFIPTLAGQRDSFDIELKIDNKRCKENYGAEYEKKCVIPEALRQKGALDFALSLQPNRDGRLFWKDKTTLTYTISPDSAWDYSEYYQIELELGQNVMINGKAKGKTTFVPAGPFYELSNLQVVPDEFEPEDRIITADLTSNYDIDEFDNMVVCNLPMGSQTPDAFFIGGSDCQPLPSEIPIDDIAVEMKDGRGRIKLLLHPDPQNLTPTFLELNGPRVSSSTSGGMGFGRAIIFFEDPEDKKSFSPKMNALVEKARNGDAQAQYDLGMAYHQGAELEKSLYKAHKWLKSAAKQDLQPAWLELGKLDLLKVYGREYYQDTHAFYWLTKAANAGSGEAQYYLGVLHADPQSHFLDGPLSLFWTTKAAKQNYVPALIRMGEIYERGFGTVYGSVAKPDYKKALDYYKTASEQKSLEGTARLARIYYLGLGVQEDHEKAYELAKKALLQADRSDLAVRDTAAKIIAEIILVRGNYGKEKDETKAAAIADRVFKEFPKPYMRMWIAQSLPVMLDTVRQRGLTFDLPVAEALAIKQQKETPNLPELRLVKALITLNNGFAEKSDIFNVYYKNALTEAVKWLEPLVNDTVLDNDAIYFLAECYSARGDKKKLWSLTEYAAYQLYFTQLELAQAFVWSDEKRGEYFRASNWYEMLGDQEGQARIRFRIFGITDTFITQLKNNIKNNPGQIRPLLEYAGFLYYQKGDYEMALAGSQKALKIDPENYDARALTGIFYFIKASQLNKKEGFSENVRKHMNAAKILGVHKWMVMLNCGLYCKDAAALLDDYYTYIGTTQEVKTKPRKQDEIMEIESSGIKEEPI